MQVAHLRVPAPAGRVEVAKRKQATWWTGVSALSSSPLSLSHPSRHPPLPALTGPSPHPGRIIAPGFPGPLFLLFLPLAPFRRSAARCRHYRKLSPPNNIPPPRLLRRAEWSRRA